MQHLSSLNLILLRVTNITGVDLMRILLNSKLNLTQKALEFYCLGLSADNRRNIRVCYEIHSTNKHQCMIWPFGTKVYDSGDDGKQKPNNFNVYIYPRCECNLYEFHSRHGWRDSSFIIHFKWYLWKISKSSNKDILPNSMMIFWQVFWISVSSVSKHLPRMAKFITISSHKISS